MNKVLVIFSGGLDSTVLLYHLKERGYEVSALSFDYGQRHIRELQAARGICASFGAQHEVLSLNALGGLLRSSQTSQDIAVPDGHYTEDTMKATVVPNRNMIMISIAAGVALSRGIGFVSYAAHAGDHTIYPDCRPPFVSAMDRVLALCDWNNVSLLAPLLVWTKAGVVRLGFELHVPFERTWSCYKGGDVHCGTCATCNERKTAFYLAGVKDPTVYVDSQLHYKE